MGAPEWALEPSQARQEYNDVGPCPCQLLISPQPPDPPEWQIICLSWAILTDPFLALMIPGFYG